MEQSLSGKIIRNTFYNVIGHFFGIFIGLFLTPYIISRIGLERFGIWAIAGVVTGYFGMFDFGIGMSFVKHIAEFYAKKDYNKINEIVNSGLLFYSIFAVIIISSAPLYVDPILRFFKIPKDLYSEALFAFFAGIIFFSISNALSIFPALQSGLQRMDISNKTGIIISVPAAAGTIFVLQNGWGLRGLIINNAVIFVMAGLANIAIAFRIFPELKISPFLFTPGMLKKLFGYGVKLQIARISSMIAVNIEKLLITRYLSIGLVTFFQLASSIVENVKSVSLLFISALMPAFSEIDARGGRKELIDSYIRGTKYLGLIAIPLFMFVIITAPQIMRIWMGIGYEKSVWIIRILGIGWLYAVLAGVRGVVVQAIGKPEMEMKGGLAVAILNIPLSIIFIIKFGFVGAALGTMLALFLGGTYAFMILHRELRIPVYFFIKATVLKSVFACLIIGSFFWGLARLSQGILFELNRISILGIFLIEAILFFGIYLGALSYAKPLDERDLATLFKDKRHFARNLLSRLSR